MSTDGIEIDRKFLLAELPAELRTASGKRIEQGYLAIADDGVQVRIRGRAAP